ncbi:MAG: Mercuric reductase [Chroococcopsis gigantea SAG 12.99]|jgi:pyruvate/2-oxoglutarate dehydrogenase complex dihydrolipoamide dehydrogenase (E3) component|nr:NAD(P)/FAD-dependent oxidoreductase [Chlorogloea purpurea SAG 13.99]MDV3001360.1 Mercuric reductase [Chroococcopsis gigantea SAG 12.99]
MAYDYDLVIIGHTFPGIYAALEALRFKSRVALIQQPYRGSAAANTAISAMTYRGIDELDDRSHRFAPDNNPVGREQRGESWAKNVYNAIDPCQYLPFLASHGIDIIEGAGEFAPLPRLSFIIGKRQITAKSFLIATDSGPTIPPDLGLESIGYTTAEDVWLHGNLEYLPRNLTIVGRSAIALQLSQTLTRCGKDITLIVETPDFLPDEDRDIARLFLARLEAEGIEVIIGNRVTQIKLIDGKKWLQVGNQVIESAEVIFASRHQRNLQGLNLKGVRVKHNSRGILLNNYLQTTNPDIYACGSLLGGSPNLDLAVHEARRVVNNLLSGSKKKLDYRSIPYTLGVNPGIARIGLTEAKARLDYEDEVRVLKSSFKAIVKSHLFDNTTGFCKLILSRRGEIIGAHLIGPEVEELISTIALAMKHKIKAQDLAQVAYPFTGLSEIIGQTASLWP